MGEGGVGGGGGLGAYIGQDIAGRRRSPSWHAVMRRNCTRCRDVLSPGTGSPESSLIVSVPSWLNALDSSVPPMSSVIASSAQSAP